MTPGRANSGLVLGKSGWKTALGGRCHMFVNLFTNVLRLKYQPWAQEHVRIAELFRIGCSHRAEHGRFMQFDLHLIGCNFRRAGLERVAHVQWQEPKQISAFLSKATATFGFDEIFFLQTCNRREFYIHAPGLDAEDPAFFHAFLNVLSDSLGLTLDPADFYHHRDADAVRHFFCVASSLDSMVLGETEIIKQIKDQCRRSNKAGHLGPRLRALVDMGLGVSKQVRHQTAITQKVVSLGSLACRTVRDRLAGVPEPTLVLVGAGHFIASLLPALNKTAGINLILVNRTLPQALAEEHQATAMTLAEFLEKPPAFDAMITATGAAYALFDGTWMQTYAPGKLIVDAALPRDVHFAAEPPAGIVYFDLEAMEKIVAENRASREAEIPRAEPFFREGLRRLHNRWLEFTLSGYSQEISQHFQHTGERALKHLFKEVSPQLNPESQEILREWTQSLMGRLTSIPILGLKGVARELGTEAVEAYTRGVASQSSLFKP